MENIVEKSAVFRLLAFLAVSVGNSDVLAQQSEGLLLNSQIAWRTDSNVMRTHEAISDNSFIFSPRIGFYDSINKHQLVIAYAGDFASYSKNKRLDYDAHDIGARLSLTHNYPFSSEFAVGYQDLIEQPGLTNAVQAIARGLNEFTQTTGRAKLNVGTVESIGQLVVSLEHSEQNYVNNQQDFRDVDRNRITNTFFYRIAPNTRLLAEVTAAEYNYDPGPSFDQSSKEWLYLTGAEWSLTAKTTGTVKVGYQVRDFDRNELKDLSRLSYMLDMLWEPNTYTKVKLEANKFTAESAQVAVEAYLSTSYRVALEHEFTSRASLALAYGHTSSEIRGLQRRNDKRPNVDLRLAYQLNAWLFLGIDYRYLARKSIYSNFDFTSNSFELSLSTRFE